MTPEIGSAILQSDRGENAGRIGSGESPIQYGSEKRGKHETVYDRIQHADPGWGEGSFLCRKNCAVLGMAYVGGFFEGTPFSEAIGYNPTAGLTLGAFAGLLTAMLLYLPRKLMTAKEFIDSIVDGIGKIVPPMLILILSWSLGGVCRQLIGTGEFISGFVSGSNLPLGLLPVLIFVIAALMSFSMGTSWGTFGMLIPIVTMICSADGAGAYLVPALGATLAGSVYGDHCSPISDTTILSSTGSECRHIRHVETQLSYATLVAAVCAVGYLIAGLSLTPWIALPVCAVLLTAAVLILNRAGWTGKEKTAA